MVVTDSTQQHIFVFSLKRKKFVCNRQVFTHDANGDAYTVDAMTISADEHRICYCDCYTNDLHISDINTLVDVTVHKGNTSFIFMIKAFKGFKNTSINGFLK